MATILKRPNRGSVFSKTFSMQTTQSFSLLSSMIFLASSANMLWTLELLLKDRAENAGIVWLAEHDAKCSSLYSGSFGRIQFLWHFGHSSP